MREFLSEVEPAKVDTEYGPVYLAPVGGRSLQVSAPVLTIEGVQCTASAFMVGGEGPEFSFIQEYSQSTGMRRAQHAIQARFVDGREVDLVTLGKISEAMLGAASWLAHSNRSLLIESRRRQVNNEVAALEREIQKKRVKLQQKERELAEIESRLRKEGP